MGGQDKAKCSKRAKAGLKTSLEPVVTKMDVKKNKHYESNIVRSLDKFKTGIFGAECLKWSVENYVSARLQTFILHKFDPQKFERRLTAIAWHPVKPNIVALGSKCGEVILRDTSAKDWNASGVRTHRHQAILSFFHDPFHTDSVYMSSVDGTFTHWNYGVDQQTELLDTDDNYLTWFCSTSGSAECGLVVAGDSTGIITLIDKGSQVVAKHKIHKGKVNTVDFCKSRGWLMATASLDSSVKLWDIRMIGKKMSGKMCQPVETLAHDRPLNSAYFSKTNGQRLLTTDQLMQLRVYSPPMDTAETIIYHPHRQFQHLTPIKASWHPLADLIVVGRYPDPVWPDYDIDLRSVDIIDSKTGKIIRKLYESHNSIISLNEFNVTGDTLASAMGLNAFYWRSSSDSKPEQQSSKSDSDSDSDPDSPPAKRKPPKRPPSNTKKTKKGKK